MTSYPGHVVVGHVTDRLGRRCADRACVKLMLPACQRVLNVLARPYKPRSKCSVTKVRGRFSAVRGRRWYNLEPKLGAWVTLSRMLPNAFILGPDHIEKASSQRSLDP